MNMRTKIIPLILTATLLQISLPTVASAASVLDPSPAKYGYYVDVWQNNTSNNNTPTSNPSIGLLSKYLDLWKPGNTLDNGQILNSEILNANISKSAAITKNRTAAESEAAFFDDRRNQNYSVIDGLGSYTDAFKKLSNAKTSITTVPSDATTKVYNNDDGNGIVWADETSKLGSMVRLVDTIRNSAASTSPAKNYFLYKRPYVWSSQVKLLPTLAPEKSTDGGFPSGHTNAATISALALAYAFPQRFQQLLTRASELGNNRIIAGMHSPLDVMGGRMTGLAITAAALNNPANAALKLKAYEEAQSTLLSEPSTSTDSFSDYSQNKANYTYRLTYGFPQISATNMPMRVPKGAEVLLETRFPYLTTTERRAVLYTTGLSSGYPLLDDAEGWGRLNLFAAADGYSAFLDNVAVNMDASKGNFNALDTWKNDISGTGGLTKNGTGILKLSGNNSYSGGTEVDNGIVEADSLTALGTGNVTLNGGTLYKDVSGVQSINNNFSENPAGTLILNISSASDLLKIGGTSNFAGTLKLNFLNNYVPISGTQIISYNGSKHTGTFSAVNTSGLPQGYSMNLSYNSSGVSLQINNGTSTPSKTQPLSNTSLKNNSSELPKTGGILNFYLLTGVGSTFIIMGTLLIFIKKRN